MITYRYYVLECDACENPLGMNTDMELPTRGLTICNECWANPAALPRHIKSALRYDQVCAND